MNICFPSWSLSMYEFPLSRLGSSQGGGRFTREGRRIRPKRNVGVEVTSSEEGIFILFDLSEGRLFGFFLIFLWIH